MAKILKGPESTLKRWQCASFLLNMPGKHILDASHSDIRTCEDAFSVMSFMGSNLPQLATICNNLLRVFHAQAVSGTKSFVVWRPFTNILSKQSNVFGKMIAKVNSNKDWQAPQPPCSLKGSPTKDLCTRAAKPRRGNHR